METATPEQIKQEQSAIAEFEDTNGKYYVEGISRAVEMMVRGIPPQFRTEALAYLSVMTQHNVSATSFYLRDAITRMIRWER